MSDIDKLHKANIDQYAKQVEALYVEFAKRIATVANNPKAKFQKSFKFSNNLEIQKKVDKELQQFNASLLEIISKGVEKEWELANTKNDALVRATIKSAKVLKIAAGLTDHNISALKAFIDRKENGLGLSDRVWKRTQEFRDELENHLQIGIVNGDSADVISRRIRQYLNAPDKLFRRVRDKNGKLVLSQAALDHNPGQGVYRSSYKNARRLTGTETNMAYRKSDHLRWQNNPTIVGFEVKLSSAHPVFDICDPAAGRYPKNFVFTGWHPNCFCYAVPIMLTDEEFDKYINAVLNGSEFDYTKSANYVSNLPNSFIKYLQDNSQKISKLKNAPYFVRDNFKGGLMPSIINAEKLSAKNLSTALLSKEQVYEKISSIEDNIRMNKSFETAVAFDNQGNEIFRKKGGATSVSFSPSETQLFKDSIFTHNHPRGWGYPDGSIYRIGSSFSPPDVRLAIVSDVAEMRAVTPHYTFSMKRPEGGWGIDVESLMMEINKINDDVYDKFNGMINRSPSSHVDTFIGRANAVHYHLVWKEFSKRYGIEYSKSKTR